jgi:hypothetical protein
MRLVAEAHLCVETHLNAEGNVVLLRFSIGTANAVRRGALKRGSS